MTPGETRALAVRLWCRLHEERHSETEEDRVLLEALFRHSAVADWLKPEIKPRPLGAQPRKNQDHE